MVEIRKILEKISLPAEVSLLNWVLEDEELVEQLRGGGRAVVIGTDRKFTIPKELEAKCPGVEVVVVDREKSLSEPAEQVGVRLVVGEVGKDKIEGVDGASLVVAKHLLHLVPDKGGVLEGMKKMLKVGGVMAVSVPTLMEKGVGEEINNIGWETEKSEVGKGLGKSLVWKLRSPERLES
ncbi:MAG: hypothetical protein ABII80_01300 [bacterium]